MDECSYEEPSSFNVGIPTYIPKRVRRVGRVRSLSSNGFRADMSRYSHVCRVRFPGS